MALTWDLTKIKWPDEYEVWIDNPNPDRKEGEEQVMNAVTEIMIFLTMLVGIQEITKSNYKDFYHRMRQFEIVTGQSGMLINKGNPDDSRNPTLEEVKWHIGLKTNANTYTKRKWSGYLVKTLSATIKDTDARIKESLDDNKGDA